MTIFDFFIIVSWSFIIGLRIGSLLDGNSVVEQVMWIGIGILVLIWKGISLIG